MPGEINSYANKSHLIDERCFQIGEIYYIADELIAIPQVDRLENSPRAIHVGRMIVIVHNHEQNYNKFYPVVTVAPLSHRTDLKRPYDLEIKIEDVDGNIRANSLIQLPLIQPVLKVDIERRIGVLKEHKIEELIAMQIDMLGIE